MTPILAPKLYADAPGRRLTQADKLPTENPGIPGVFGRTPTIINLEVAETESA